MRRENARRIRWMTVAALAASGAVGQGTLQRLVRQELSFPNPAERQSVADSRKFTAWPKPYGRVALSFEANIGQTGFPVKFFVRNGDSTVFLTASSIVLALKRHHVRTGETDSTLVRAVSAAQTQTGAVLRINFAGANPAPEMSGINQLPGKSHYLIGNDRERWHTNIPNFASVHYRSIYPGIDLVFYGKEQRLEYDFVVAPGADPSAIKLRFEGALVKVDPAGDLVLETPDGELRQRRPFAFQLADGSRKAVVCRYVVEETHTVGIQVGTYDATRPLIVDPVLSYSSYLGGGAGDRGNAIAVDSAGNAYITGETLSIDFPVSPGAVQTMTGGSNDVFVTKLDSTGTTVVYSTYLGGTGNDRGSSISVDSTGSAYVTGRVASVDFPTTPGAFRTFFSGGNYDAFITKLSPDGSSFMYSTYLGGTENDAGYGIAVDAAGGAYVTGGTSSQGDFPVTGGAFQPTYGGGVPGNDAFVTKINPTGDALDYSSYLGGSFVDRPSSIAVDSAGSAYVTGWTESPDFPLVNPWQPALSGVRDAYVTKVSPDGTSLVYSTFLGGGGVDAGIGIAVDASGSPYVTGYTESENFPTINAFQRARGGGRDAFVTKFDSAMSAPVYSTYLGGSGDENVGGMEVVGAIAIDATGSAYVSGATRSADFPTLNAAQPSLGGNVDAFVTRLDAAGSPLYSTYLGGGAADVGTGIAVDSAGAAYVTGQTASGDFPVVNPLQPTIAGGPDAFVAKLADVFTAIDVAVDAIGRTRVLRTDTEGRASLWTFGPSGERENSISVGPFAGWTARAIGVAPDGRTRLLWTHRDGQVALWFVSASGVGETAFYAGPFSGWTAVDVSVGSDDRTRLLWTHASGAASVFMLTSEGGYESQADFGPFGGWSARRLDTGADNRTRLWWTDATGTTALWSLDASGALETAASFGPFSGWTLGDVGVGADNKARLLWRHASGATAVWIVSAAGDPEASIGYGPIPGWTARALDVGTDDRTRLLWSETSGSTTVWVLSPSGAYETQFYFGANQIFAASITDGRWRQR